MSVRVFLKEIRIWIGKLSKTDFSAQCGGIVQYLRARIKENIRGRSNSLFLAGWAGTLIFPWPLNGTYTIQNRTTPPAYLGLQIVGSRSWTYICISIFITIFILLVLFLWRALISLMQWRCYWLLFCEYWPVLIYL